MISVTMPIRKHTAVSRRCSSSTVPTSLKSGTTIERRTSPPRTLRDMTQTPARRAREIVSDQLNALADEKRLGLHAAEQRDLFQPRVDEARGPSAQRVVDVAGVNHQFGDARPCAAKHLVQRRTCE